MFASFKTELREMYESRNVLRALIRKDLFGRYKNSAIGFAWHFIIPIVMMVVYYVVFQTVRANAIPDFWVFLASGLFPFNFMMTNLNRGPGMIVTNGPMVKKMYFPRAILIISEVLSSFIIMLIGYSIILVAIALSGYPLTWAVLFLPVILVLMLVFVLGYSLILSAITVYMRDIQYLINSLSMVFYFLTPMYFSLSDVSGIFGTIILINPFTYYVESFHQMIYHGVLPDAMLVGMCALIPVLFLVAGIIVFRRLKRGFAERL